MGKRPRERQCQEESPRWKDASKCQADQKWQAGAANEDPARFPRLMVVVPLDGQVLDMKGRDQIAADGRVSAV